MKRKLSPKKAYGAFASRVEAWDLNKVTKRMGVFALVLALAGGYLWYSRLYMTDERRFWLAVENSMATGSVTRTVETGGSGNQVIQDQQFFFSPQMASRSHVSFTQKNATVDTFVETEGVSFPDSQYSRYTSFRTNQDKEDGSTPNLDDVLGKWEGNVVSDEQKDEAKLNYVSELVTLAIFGNYDAEFRKEVVSALKSNGVYSYNTLTIRREDVNGRELIIVPVSIKLRAYAEQLQRAFIRAGYGEFPPLTPENYREDSKISADFSIDPRTNAIVGIKFGTREESYTGYGIYTNVVAPNTDFESGELEGIVQEEIRGAL